MKRIFKYKLRTTDEQTIRVPTLKINGKIVDFSEQILKIDVQHGDLYLWCMVNDDQEEQEHYVYIFGTGHEIEDEYISKHFYVGSYQLCDGNFVGHVFIK